MINSLMKDSHTYPSLSQTSKMNATKSMVGDVSQHRTLNTVKRDVVSFGGISAARLANKESAKTVFKAAKEFLESKGQKATPKQIGKMVSEIASKVAGGETLNVSKVSDVINNLAEKSDISAFAKKHSADLDKLFSDASSLIKSSQEVSYELKRAADSQDVKKVAKGFKIVRNSTVGLDGTSKGFSFKNEFADNISKDVRIAMETYPTVEKAAVKGKSFYSNSKLNKMLSFANENSAVFSALAAAVFACGFRPATIMALPAKGKNKEDNKYSAAHSIASGITGAAVAMAVNLPIALALKKFSKNPSAFAKKLGSKVADSADAYANKFMKDIEGKLSYKDYDQAQRAINLTTELIFAIPQALLTTALIPPVLKKLGIQKAPKNAAKDTPVENKNVDNSNKSQSNQVNFKGHRETGLISTGFSKLFSSNKFNGFVDKISKNGDFVSKISTAKSALISALYITRTLKNENLDPNRRTTLAVNQGCVWGAATVLNITFNKGLDKIVDKFTDNFRAANIEKLISNIKDAAIKAGKPVSEKEALERATVSLNRLNGGIKTAKALIIVSLVYRYLSPVLVTPIANKIGNWIEAKKNEKAASKA